MKPSGGLVVASLETVIMTGKLGTGRRALPLATDLIASFDTAESLEEQHVIRLARQLAHQHLEQWITEDACRTPGADIATIAASKQAIDAMNSQRAVMIEEIDQWFERSLVSKPDVPLHTETFGSVVDRLGIAWVRARRLSRGPQTSDHLLARQALKQLAELAEAYDCLIRDVRNGRRRVPQWRLLKRYGASS